MATLFLGRGTALSNNGRLVVVTGLAHSSYDPVTITPTRKRIAIDTTPADRATSYQEAFDEVSKHGLNREVLGTSTLDALIQADAAHLTTSERFDLVMRTVAGGNMGFEGLPTDARYQAARKLFGVEKGMAGASYARRRDEASRHLRARRPQDPYLDADAPLSGRQQRLKLQALIRELAADLVNELDNLPAPGEPMNRPQLYDVLEIDYSVVCDVDGNALEKIEDWLIVVYKPVSHFPKTWMLDDADPTKITTTCIGGRLTKIQDKQAGFFISDVQFDAVLPANAQRRVRLVSRFHETPAGRHLTARSTRPAEVMRVRLQFPADTPMLVSPIVQELDYYDDQFPALHTAHRLDSCGYFEIEYRNMLPLWNYGIAWHPEQPRP